MDIRVDDLTGAAIQALIREHLRNLRSITPEESVHALDLDALRRPEITFWSAWNAGDLLGCCALKALDKSHGEIKSMRTASPYLRKGVASNLLRHIIDEARRRSYRRLSLETGAPAAFVPARSLYGKYGFRVCGPFADYPDDPNSVFMTLDL